MFTPSHIMELKLAHINPDTTALYNVIETRNPFSLILPHMVLVDNFKYSKTSGSFLRFHRSIEEAVASARDFQKTFGGQIEENGLCNVPRLQPSLSDALVNTSKSKSKSGSNK